MTCSRCCGLMIEDHFLDLEGALGEMWITSWRCMNCGHIHDAMIAENRMTQLERLLVSPGAEPAYQDDAVHLGAKSFIGRAA